jgi:hypothetical protein
MTVMTDLQPSLYFGAGGIPIELESDLCSELSSLMDEATPSAGDNDNSQQDQGSPYTSSNIQIFTLCHYELNIGNNPNSPKPVVL